MQTTSRDPLTAQLMVRLSEPDRDRLVRIAEAEDRPLGWLIRRAVLGYLAERGSSAN